mmetsp:Transcript_26994/g.77455  ORF Transcript_26994/g.77455 Transcript_26994/m.77455 type:complete len:261 (+) Transcript_26994:358-1140(+)
MMWSAATAMCKGGPAARITPEHLPTMAPMTKAPEATPATGTSGAMRLHNLGAAELESTPRQTGRSTTCTAERRMPSASTGTIVPSTSFGISGVNATAASVVDEVISTERGTSAPAISAQRLEVEPPLTLPRRTMPTSISCDRPTSQLSATAAAGTRRKQARRLIATGRGFEREARNSSGRVVMPTENDSTTRSRVVEAGPSHAKALGRCKAVADARLIHTAKRLQKPEETARSRWAPSPAIAQGGSQEPASLPPYLFLRS